MPACLLFLITFSGALALMTADVSAARVTEPATSARQEVAPRADERITRAQTLLQGAGFYNGPLDGFDGPSTREAVMAYQKTRGLEANGFIDEALLEHLETLGKVEGLLGRLDDVRQREQQEARTALLANPVTRTGSKR